MIQTDLSGKVSVVTGASAGMGAAIAKRFADCGSAVVLVGSQIFGVVMSFLATPGKTEPKDRIFRIWLRTYGDVARTALVYAGLFAVVFIELYVLYNWLPSSTSAAATLNA